jgi:sugar O-acyltransferase (sialic acid O-acetyltransferase NeuD family)
VPEKINMAKIILQGGGDHARVVLDCLLEAGEIVSGIFDPRQSGELFGVPQLGPYRSDFEPSSGCIIAIGDNSIRKKVSFDTKHSFINVIHPTSVISPRAEIGTGNMILHRAIIQAGARVGNHVIINTGAQVDHDCVIGDFVHLAPGVILCGTVSVGEGSFIGAGAIVIPGKTIGRWATVGAGTIVRQDVPDFAVVVGNPGRVIRTNTP